MKNSETSTLTILKNKEIQANIHTAMIRLNEFDGWKVGLPLMVKYYNQDQKVDTIFAIGVKNSLSSSDRGGDFYSIIATEEYYYIDGVFDIRPNMSYVVNGEKYLYCYETEEDKLANNKIWKIAKRVGDHLGTGTLLDGPYIFKNLSDNLKYFYTDGILKKENDFITPEELYLEVSKLTTSFKNEITELYVIGGDTYSKSESYGNLQIHIKIENYKNIDITSDYTITLRNGSLEKIDDNTYRILDEVSTTTTYQLDAIDNYGNTLTKDFIIYIVDYTYYGKMTEFDINNLATLEKTLWNGKGNFEFTINLGTPNNDGQITVLAVPENILGGDFMSIRDENKLNYINDYTISRYSVFDTMYKIYYKKDQVVISNFKQIFSYE